MKTLICTFALLLAVLTPALAQNGFRANGPGPGTPVVITPATDAEIQWLTFMREEEKLARDVYTALGEKWNLIVFKNIAASEDRHFASVGVLLTRYGIKDPASTLDGVYTDSRLSALYAELMAKGSKSVQDALEVGVLIEKADIADLEKALAATTKTDLKRVFTNLLDGSYSHLEAFESNLEVVCTVTGQ